MKELPSLKKIKLRDFKEKRELYLQKSNFNAFVEKIMKN